MALKQFYNSETDVPTELKDHYVLKDGKYELSVEGFDSVPAVFTKNKELIDKQKLDKTEMERLTTDLATSKIEIGKLSGDLAKAGANSLPAGYVAVAKKDAEALEEFKKKNLAPSEALSKLEELDTLNSKVRDMELEKSIVEFAEAENIHNVEALTRFIKQDGITPKVKEVEENGKKEKRGFFTVVNGDKTEERSYKDYRESNWKPIAAALDVEAEKKKKPGNSQDPPPAPKGDETEIAKAAQAGQARTVHNAF